MSAAAAEHAVTSHSDSHHQLPHDVSASIAKNTSQSLSVPGAEDESSTSSSSQKSANGEVYSDTANMSPPVVHMEHMDQQQQQMEFMFNADDESMMPCSSTDYHQSMSTYASASVSSTYATAVSDLNSMASPPSNGQQIPAMPSSSMDQNNAWMSASSGSYGSPMTLHAHYRVSGNSNPSPNQLDPSASPVLASSLPPPPLFNASHVNFKPIAPEKSMYSQVYSS